MESMLTVTDSKQCVVVSCQERSAHRSQEGGRLLAGSGFLGEGDNNAAGVLAIASQIKPTQVHESHLLPLFLSLTARILKSLQFLGIAALHFLSLSN